MKWRGKDLRVGCCVRASLSSLSLFLRFASAVFIIVWWTTFSPPLVWPLSALFPSFPAFDQSDGFDLVFSNSLNNSKRGS